MNSYLKNAMASIEAELDILQPLQHKHKRTTRKPEYARLKMGMKYIDKNDSFMYSYDYFGRVRSDRSKYYVRDEREGLAYLKREIVKQFRLETLHTAYIYICFGNTSTSEKNYDFEIAHYVKGKTPILVPLKWIEGKQEIDIDKPRPSKLETMVDMQYLFTWFKAFGFHKLVDENGKTRFFPEK